MNETSEMLNKSVLFGFTDGTAYDEGRPEYTPESAEMVLNIADKVPKVPGAEWDLVEVGAGTGKFTKQILKQLNKPLKYLASEPVTEFYQTLQKNCTTITTQQFSAESIPLEDEKVRNVLAAQCFHWFASPTALQEIQRVLVPGGNLILVWYFKDYEVDWLAKIGEIVKDKRENTPNYRSFIWKKALDEFKAFELEKEQILPGPVFKGPPEFVAHHFQTMSYISSMPKDEREKIFEKITTVVRTHPQTKGKEVVTLPIKIHIFHYRKSKCVANIILP